MSCGVTRNMCLKTKRKLAGWVSIMCCGCCRVVALWLLSLWVRVILTSVIKRQGLQRTTLGVSFRWHSSWECSSGIWNTWNGVDFFLKFFVTRPLLLLFLPMRPRFVGFLIIVRAFKCYRTVPFGNVRCIGISNETVPFGMHLWVEPSFGISNRTVPRGVCLFSVAHGLRRILVVLTMCCVWVTAEKNLRAVICISSGLLVYTLVVLIYLLILFI